jgi:hypothetical protein
MQILIECGLCRRLWMFEFFGLAHMVLKDEFEVRLFSQDAGRWIEIL